MVDGLSPFQRGSEWFNSPTYPVKLFFKKKLQTKQNKQYPIGQDVLYSGYVTAFNESKQTVLK